MTRLLGGGRQPQTNISTKPLDLASAEVWKCYARLHGNRVKTLEPGEALTHLISLVHFATGQQAELARFPELARQRFQDWLTQQETATGNLEGCHTGNASSRCQRSPV